MRTAVVLLLVVTGGLAGCGSGDRGAGPSPSSTAWTEARILAVGREYADCVRARGVPDFPDPTVVGGRLDLSGPTSEPARRAYRACASIIGRLPASVYGKGEPPPRSNDDLATLRRFAQCIRSHGARWFPDPQPNGDFLLDGTPMARQIEPPPADYFAAEAKCRQFEGPGISLRTTR